MRILKFVNVFHWLNTVRNLVHIFFHGVLRVWSPTIKEVVNS